MWANTKGNNINKEFTTSEGHKQQEQQNRVYIQAGRQASTEST
jgi:hypothetical protein